MNTSDDILKSLAQGFLPQEEMLEVARKKSNLQIGIPKEISNNENRIPLVPESVNLLVENGLVGFFLVVLLLAMFLNWRLAFWVALAIPISFAGKH